jgi:chromosome segregation ATPase
VRLALKAVEHDAEGARERAEKATPGPWEAEQDGVLVYVVTAEPQSSGHREAVALIDDDTGRLLGQDADADFIAHARTDIPALADALEAAEKKLARHRAEDYPAQVSDLSEMLRDAETELARLRGENERLREAEFGIGPNDERLSLEAIQARRAQRDTELTRLRRIEGAAREVAKARNSAWVFDPDLDALRQALEAKP